MRRKSELNDVRRARNYVSLEWGEDGIGGVPFRGRGGYILR